MDDCCQSRPGIKSIFPNISVVQDIKHVNTNSTNNNIDDNNILPITTIQDNCTIFLKIQISHPDEITGYEVPLAESKTSYTEFENSLFDYCLTLKNLKCSTGKSINWESFTNRYNYLIQLNKKNNSNLNIYKRTISMLKDKKKVKSRIMK